MEVHPTLVLLCAIYNLVVIFKPLACGWNGADVPNEPKTRVVSIQECSDISIQHDLAFDNTPNPECTPGQLYDSYVYDICERYPNVDPEVVRAVIWTESRYNQDAVNYDGSCVGLMQVSTKWHAERASRLGIKDFFDPYSNITLGVDYLSELMLKYNDMEFCLMCYNMGESAAKKAIESMYAKKVLAKAEVLRSGGDIFAET